MPEFSLNVYLFVSFVVFFAIFIRTLTGLGGALISVSILSLFFPFKFVVGFDTLIETLVLSVFIAFIYKDINFNEVKPLAFGAVVGTLVGAVFLTNYSEHILRVVLGVVIIISVCLLVIEQVQHIKMPYRLGYFFGFLGGSFGSVVGSSAPPFAVFLSGRITKKHTLRASIITLVLAISLFRSFVFVYTGIITLTTIYWVFAVLPVVFVSTYLSNILEEKINNKTLKQIVILLILALGIGLLFT